MSLPSYCYDDDERDAKDAARYRWLKARAPQALAMIAYGASNAACAIPSSNPDAAIDAAMKGAAPDMTTQSREFLFEQQRGDMSGADQVTLVFANRWEAVRYAERILAAALLAQDGEEVAPFPFFAKEQKT